MTCKVGLLVACVGIVIVALVGDVALQAQTVPVPQFRIDPDFPKPLPQQQDAEGQMRRWVTGAPGGVCIDSHDHVFTFNRGGPMSIYEGMSGVLSPQVIVYDASGAVINSWGPHPKPGEPNALPQLAHGCHVDYEDNVWLTGIGDGIAQKWSHDGKTLLMTIGVKGQCDGPSGAAPKSAYPTCGETGAYNRSQTLLNSPAKLWVDPNPDPVTKERGSVYIADGYGNHRVVVFDRTGKFLRQFGEPGKGPGQFGPAGDAGPGPAGGHPHCVTLSNDGLVYACDRANNRVFEFNRTGVLKRTIHINPVGGLRAPQRTADVDFSRDPQQTYIYNADLGNNVVHIVDRASGKIVGHPWNRSRAWSRSADNASHVGCRLEG